MAGGVRETIEGYVLDDVYPSNFHREFTPNWIDAMLRHRGIAPPRAPGAPFALMDLGCGDGLALVVIAAAHPEGRFVGVDALPEHAALGERVAAECGVDNVTFRCARFADLADPPEPEFDYVTAQGVMSWVSAENQCHVRRIAASHLRPGGVAALGYNALPGWKDALAFQQMVRMLADEEKGGAVARFDAALGRIRALGAAGAASFSKTFMEWIDGMRARLPGSYFPHEYLNLYWTPHWSAEMIEAMAAFGFSYAATGRTDRLREDFCLKAAQRRELDRIANPLARETAADIFVHSSFRVDLYDREPSRRPAPPDARLDGWWAAAIAADDAEYSCRTAAGTLKFDNEASHAIMRALEAGPAQLGPIQAEGEAGTAADVLNGADALFIAGHILPAGPPVDPPAARAVNAYVAAQVRAGAGTGVLAGRHGPMPLPVAAIAAATADGASGEVPDREAAQALLTRLAIA